jgi:hypothetical protein
MLVAIEAWPLAAAVRHSLWAYPVLEVVHIAALGTLFGSLLLLDLRLFGFGRAIDVPALGRYCVRVALVAFVFAACSGLLMLAARATELVENPVFQAKLALIALAGVNARLFHKRRGLERHDGVARLQGILSFTIWVGVISAGRFIAYY